MVTKASDFNSVEDGGCNQLCKQVLACGHICPRFCRKWFLIFQYIYLLDPYPHDKLLCTKPCTKKHKNCNHPCAKRCYEDCGNCEVVVEKTLPCGHKDQVSLFLKFN